MSEHVSQSEIVGQGSSHTVYKLPGDPRFVTRNETWVNTDVSLDTAVRYKQVLHDLSTQFGIPSPGCEILAAPDQPEDSEVQIISLRVFGTPLDSVDNLSTIPREVPEEIVAKIINYYGHVYENGGDYEADLVLGQFVRGTTATDPVEQSYFADLEPSNVQHFGKPPSKTMLQRFDASLDFLMDSVTQMEQAYGQDYTHLADQIEQILIKTRAQYEQITDNKFPTTPS